MSLNQTDIDVLRHEFDSPGGLDALQDLLNYLQTISIQENPVVKPESNAESLALEPYTWNRIHFSTIDEWMSVRSSLFICLFVYLLVSGSSLFQNDLTICSVELTVAASSLAWREIDIIRHKAYPSCYEGYTQESTSIQASLMKF